jgi:hypothetical protein
MNFGIWLRAETRRSAQLGNRPHGLVACQADSAVGQIHRRPARWAGEKPGGPALAGWPSARTALSVATRGGGAMLVVAGCRLWRGRIEGPVRAVPPI